MVSKTQIYLAPEVVGAGDDIAEVATASTPMSESPLVWNSDRSQTPLTGVEDPSCTWLTSDVTESPITVHISECLSLKPNRVDASGCNDSLHERITLPPDIRRRINGETARVMKHAEALKSSQGDTSADMPWSIDRSLSARDRYVMFVSTLWLSIKLLFLFFPAFLVQMPFILLLKTYVCCQPTPCDSPARQRVSFKLFCCFMFIVGLPMLFLASISYVLDLLPYYMFSLSFCCATCRWSRLSKSLKTIAPYRGGPLLVFYWSDFVTALMGQVWRQGITDVSWMLAFMWISIPWIKYFVNTNPFIYDLEERLLQQISTSMQDMSVPEIMKASERIISRTKQKEELRGRVDKWAFVPHYPLPPPWRRWSVGLQAVGSHVKLLGLKALNCWFMLTHVTHAGSSACNSTEQFVLSNSCIAPCFRVMLWYNNPYHIFTGWVEASISSGGDSQPDKNRGCEHPMWLVTGRSPLLADRGSLAGHAMIDVFFDKWLPTIVHEIRRLVRGKEVADELYEEVVSKEGVSRPAQCKKIPMVEMFKE